MQLPTILLTLLTGSTFAAPATRSTKAPRQCEAFWPNQHGNFILTKSSPDADIPSQDLDFSISEDRQGPCTLVVSFPKGKGIYYSGNVRTSVYATEPRDGITEVGSLVGTVDLKGSAEEDTLLTINSFECKPEMGFRFQLDGEGDGDVKFYQGDGMGIAMHVGC